MTNKQKIINKLERDGFVDNFWSIENKVSLRLGAVIEVLKKEGWKFSAKSGYLPGTKNWRYYIEGYEPKKPIWEDYEKDGMRYTRLVGYESKTPTTGVVH